MEEIQNIYGLERSNYMRPNLPPDQPGFFIRLQREDQLELGFRVVMNPRIGEQPDKILDYSFWGYDDVLVEVVTPQMDCPSIRTILQSQNILITEDQDSNIGSILDSISLNKPNKTDMVIVFDLKKPLRLQLEAAEEFLLEAYKKLGLPTTKRRRPQKWLGYLRTLDAREDGASWREMCEIFYAQKVLDRHKNPSGGYRPPPPQAARDLWKAANALRFNF